MEKCAHIALLFFLSNINILKLGLFSSCSQRNTTFYQLVSGPVTSVYKYLDYTCNNKTLTVRSKQQHIISSLSIMQTFSTSTVQQGNSLRSTMNDPWFAINCHTNTVLHYDRLVHHQSSLSPLVLHNDNNNIMQQYQQYYSILHVHNI